MIIRQTEFFKELLTNFQSLPGCLSPEKKMININDLVKSSVLLQKAVYDDIQFNLHLNNLSSNIFGDSAMLSQALTNLLKNSVNLLTHQKGK